MGIEKISEAASMVAQMTGYGHTTLRRSLDAGKETPEAKKVRVREALEEERKKVQRVYNAERKRVEYDKYGRHLQP